MATNQDNFFEAFNHATHRFLELELQPFSLLHYQWLEQIASPVVRGDLPCTIADLEVAALICASKTSDEIQRRLARPKSFLETFRLARWRGRNAKRNLLAEMQAFAAYRDDYLALPRFAPSEDESKVVEEKLPWLLVSAAIVVKATGWSRDDVFRMPLGELIWWRTALAYLQTGETNVISDKEAEGLELMQRLMSGALTDGKE